MNRKWFWIVLLLGPEVLGTEEDNRRSRMTRDTSIAPTPL